MFSMILLILILIILALIFSATNNYYYKKGKEVGWKNGVEDTFEFLDHVINEEKEKQNR